LLSTLLLLGAGGLGKSKLMHMIAQELCAAYESDTYVFAKSIDPLGLLSHTGELRKSAVLMLTDFDLRTTKGILSNEEVKGLFDVVEGGSIQGTRYRPANLPEGLCRVAACNGDSGGYGAWFAKYGQRGLSIVIGNLALGDAGLETAATELMRLSSDEQAAARRFAVAICEGTLVTADTVVALRAAAKAKAVAGLARRQARDSA